MGLATMVTFIVIIAVNGAFESYPYIYLVPWLLGLGIVMAIPSLVLHYQGRFSFADPLVFATWSYFFPAFVVGGMFFAAGLSQPSHATLIQDADYNMPLTVVMVGLAFAGLAVGYFLPVGSRLGGFIAKILPQTDHKPSTFIFPGLVLLFLGVMNTVAAFAMGLFGFQKGDEINSYDGLIYLTTLFWMQASFLLWFVIFRQKKITFVHVPVIVLLLATSISKALFAGNRGSIIQIFTIIALAYILAGRQFKFKQGVIAASVLSVGIFVGMLYGTTFRQVKGTESAQGAGQYTENIINTFEQVGRNDTYESIMFGFTSLTERFDIFSVLAVVVSNYEVLRPYEEAYGIDDNIWVELTTFFIPRVVWNDKPYTSDPRKFSDLYFNYGESSYAITPIGDLLRNYGIIGVPLGMLILGIIMRMIYFSLVEARAPAVWKIALYFMLLTAVSYEGFYATIIPSLFKVGFTAIVGILIVMFLAKRMDRGVSFAR
jgi:hypothetical protein